MLAIGELADRIGVPTHVLRYWETRFPELKPLQRSGRRRYYRATDVALAEQIHHLLHVRGFTVDGARKALAEPESADGADGIAVRPSSVPDARAEARAAPIQSVPVVRSVPVQALVNLRKRLADALKTSG
jgi:DNA-binding transcriptional MerR regulator